MKFPALRKEVIVGFISFIFGGVLVAIFQGYLDRPKPQMSVKDISFDNNSGKSIQISATELAKNDELIHFNNYMSYKEILAQEQIIGNSLSKLRGLKLDLSHWKEQNLSSDANIATNLNLFPIFDNADYSKFFVLSTQKINPNDIPTKIEELGKNKVVFDAGIEPKNEKFFITTDGKRREITSFSATTQKDVKTLNNIIFTFRTNNSSNLLFYVNQCLNDIDNRISSYQDILGSLQNVLITNSKIKIKVTIYNNGKDAVVLHPYFKLEVFNEKNIAENYLMNTIDWERDDLKPLTDYMHTFQDLMKEGLESESKKTRTENNYQSFFQDKKTFPHLSIPGGQNITVILETSSSLNDKGNDIKKWFESGALFCRVDGLTVDDDEIKSPDILFNANIQDKVREKLGL